MFLISEGTVQTHYFYIICNFFSLNITLFPIIYLRFGLKYELISHQNKTYDKHN